MNHLIVFYLLTSAIQILPGVLVTVSLQYGLPYQHLQRVGGGPQYTGISRLAQAFLFDADIINKVARFSLMTSTAQVTTVLSTCLAIYCDLPFPFIGNISTNNPMAEGAMSYLMIFLLTTSALHLIPMVLVILAFINDIHIPFLPMVPENREPLSDEDTQRSHACAIIHLTRFKTVRQTTILAKLEVNRLDRPSKVVFCRKNEVGAETKYYHFNEANRTLEQVIPAPITVNELERIFSFGNN